MTEQSGERDALRAVYEAARRVLRFNSIDREQTLASIEALRDAIEQVKSIDAGYGDEFAPPTPEQAGPSGEPTTNPHGELWWELALLAQDMALHPDDRFTCSLASDALKLASPGAMEGAQPSRQVADALRPFAEIGAWLFARPLPDDTPMFGLTGLNGSAGTLTRGDFKAAHTALLAMEGAQAAQPEPVAWGRKGSGRALASWGEYPDVRYEKSGLFNIPLYAHPPTGEPT